MCLAECLDDDRVQGEAFEFSTESPMSVLELVTVIQRLMGCGRIELEVQNCAKGEIRIQYLSATKARTILGWQPGYGLEAGLQETIDWYRRFLAEERL